ncbi:hypothetical protein ABFS83_06G166300 [Erythranthe nasuta]
MGSPERVRSSVKRDTEEDIEVNIDIVRDEEDWVGDDKRKQRSSKSKKQGTGEDVDGLDGSGKIRSLSDRHESRKRSADTSRADSDQDDYESRKESRSKQVKKKSEENTLDVLSTWYQDGEAENKPDGGDKPGSRGSGRAEESERMKSFSKFPDPDYEGENLQDRDLRDLERWDNERDKGYGYADHGRSHRRRWDEAEHGEKSDARSAKSFDAKVESASDRERSDPLGIDGIKSHDREGRSEFLEEDNMGSLTRDAISNSEIFEEHTQQRNPTQDILDGRARSLNADEDVSTLVRDKRGRDVESNSARTPEKIGRRQTDSDNIDCDYERSTASRRKELGKEGSWDDRSKERDDSWGDRNRDREDNKDTWKRKQDKEARDAEPPYDVSMRDWDMPRRGRDRMDGRPGGRKDGRWNEHVKASYKYGISNENYDVIEIQTKSELIPDAKPAADMDERSRNTQRGSTPSGEDTKDRSTDGDLAMRDQQLWRDDNDSQSEKSREQKCIVPRGGSGGQSSSGGGGGSLHSHGNQDPGSFNRAASQGARGNRLGRGGRGRPTGRDTQQPGIPLPFGPLVLPPPGPMQSLPPNMSPAPVPITPGVYIPPFQSPIVWPGGGRGIEMNMLGLPPVPPGPLGPRFSHNLGNLGNLGNAPGGGLMFSPSGPGRGMPPSMSVPNFNVMSSPVVRGQQQDNKGSGGWLPPRTNAPAGKAPSRGEQNDYSQNFVDTGMRPQNYIRELEITSVVEDYPKLRELIQKKDEIVAKSASAPMYYKCDLREQVLSPEMFGTKFDVILVDPPWEEYVHRAPGVTDHMESWTFEEIMNLKIEAIADTPSFIFLWVGDGVGLEKGRQCLKKWGFRRCEDICWVKTNKTNATPGLRHDSHTLLQRSKEHCLMGIKGTVRRSSDSHIIHANIDTDVIIAEEPPYGSTAKPEDMYRIVEHFALGRRRLELFGEDHNIRSGWLTVGKELSSSNFNSEVYIKSFADKDGKVWLGGGGRNPPPEAPHLVLTTPEIESLRPKSPMKNQQQMQQQQQLASINLTPANSVNKRPTSINTGNSPQNHNIPNMNILEASGSNIPSPATWASPMPNSDERMFDVYGYNTPFGPNITGEFFGL